MKNKNAAFDNLHMVKGFLESVPPLDGESFFPYGIEAHSYFLHLDLRTEMFPNHDCNIVPLETVWK
jgi:hypothetical protein